MASPNQGGGTGDECEEIWTLTEACAILVIGPPYQGVFVFFPDREPHFLYLPAILVISLRIPWVVLFLAPHLYRSAVPSSPFPPSTPHVPGPNLDAPQGREAGPRPWNETVQRRLHLRLASRSHVDASLLKDLLAGGAIPALINQTNADAQPVHAIVHERYGAPEEVLHLASLTDPGVPTGTQMRIRVTHCPVHPGDIQVIQGASIGGPPAPIPPGQPRVPGFEGIGTIETLGPDVGRSLGFKRGQRVAFFPAPGAWSSIILVPAPFVLPVPDALADGVAAQMLINTITAQMVLRAGQHSLPAEVERPVWFVQTAAGSAVGRLITVLALEQGFRPLRLVRTREGAELLQATLPGAPVFSLSDADWPDQVRHAAAGRSIPLALDAIGGSFLDALVSILADGSAIMSYGLLGTGSPDLGPFIARELRLQGVSIGRWALTRSPQGRAEDTATALRLAQTRPELFAGAAEYPFAEMKQAVGQVTRPGKRGTVLLAVEQQA